MNQFVGFGSSAEWLKSIRKDQPVNADCVTQIGKAGKYGISIASTSIILSQVAGGEVLYVMITISRYQTLNGEPFDRKDHERKVKRDEIAFDLTIAWLAHNDITARKAMIAMPLSYRMLQGNADYMQWNKESDAWEPTQDGAQ